MRSFVLLYLCLSWITLSSRAFLTLQSSRSNLLSPSSITSISTKSKSMRTNYSSLSEKKTDFHQIKETSTLDNNPTERQTKLLLFILLPVLITAPLVASALDHPVDYASLRIPNPLPDADLRYFLSGGLCAATSHGITTPIDVVKTRMQAEPTVYDEGLLNAARSIIATDGTTALVGGLGPTVVGYGLEGAVKFGLYESLKPTVAKILSLDDPAVPYLVSSVVAGAVASLMLVPMERTRIRLVTDPSFASGLITGLSKIVKEDGILSTFSGMPAMLSKQVPYTVTKQVSFDIFSVMLYSLSSNANLIASNIKIEVAVVAAFLASILSCLASHPGDVVLTATYKNQGSNNCNSGFLNIVSSIYQDRGLNGFFTGLTARFLHVGAIITSQLVLYDFIKQLLGLPATGTH